MNLESLLSMQDLPAGGDSQTTQAEAVGTCRFMKVAETLQISGVPAIHTENDYRPRILHEDPTY